METTDRNSPPSERSGVVAVIRNNDTDDVDRFLVIRRSQFVSAAGKYCFPGGGVETGESDEQALPRELREEVNIRAPRLIRPIWESRSMSGIKLNWWIVEIGQEELIPDPEEVAEIHWWTIDEMRGCGNLLQSNEDFLLRWEAGDFA